MVSMALMRAVASLLENEIRGIMERVGEVHLMQRVEESWFLYLNVEERNKGTFFLQLL